MKGHFTFIVNRCYRTSTVYCRKKHQKKLFSSYKPPVNWCDKETPPLWPSPPFWWKGDVARRGIPVGDINDYDFIRPPDELPEPVNMLAVLQIERPERYIPGRIYKTGLAGIGDECFERHQLAKQKALINKGICPSEANKLPDCLCSENLSAKEIKETDECKEEIKKKKERIPYCPEKGDVFYKSLQDPKKWPECPCYINSKKEHNNDNPVITPKNNSNGTPNDPENKNKINFEKNEVENGDKEYPDICLCPESLNVKGDEDCGSPGQIERPCHKEPYVLLNNESHRPCRDKLRNEEMSKVGLPFKREACRWFNKLHPPLRVIPIGKTDKKMFPQMRYSNL